MWKTLLSILRHLFNLARDLEENRKEIKELNEKIYVLATSVRSLSEKIDANSRHEASERKALILQLENELLKADRAARLLERGKTKKGKKKASSKK